MNTCSESIGKKKIIINKKNVFEEACRDILNKKKFRIRDYVKKCIQKEGLGLRVRFLLSNPLRQILKKNSEYGDQIR